MKDSKTLLIVVVIVVPLFCLALAIGGVFIGYGLTSAVRAGSGPSLSPEQTEAEVLRIAHEYTNTYDLEKARQQLSDLNLPNTDQYVSFMADRYIQENRGSDDVETQDLFKLADALGVASPAMAMALASPTPPPTDTPIPDTPTPTITPIPPTATEPPVAQATDMPVPVDTPVPTDTLVPPTNTPGPPTNTPEPTATPEPTKPAVDYVVAEAHMIRNPQYNSCPGTHQIFVTVVDAAGNPLDGVTVEDTFSVVPPHTSGEKGPGKLEYDLWDNGFSLHVTKKQDGSPAASEVTPKLSSWDEDIPNEWLVEANYCLDLNDCLQRKSSNQLCRGHYAYNVTFKRTY